MSTSILDGNHLAATERRIVPLRECASGPLPAVSLVAYDPDLDLPVHWVRDLDVVVTVTGPRKDRSKTSEATLCEEPVEVVGEEGEELVMLCCLASAWPWWRTSCWLWWRERCGRSMGQ